MKSLPLAPLALLALAGVADAQSLKIERYTLPNGMKVILHEDHSLPLATINTWFAVGSKDEPDKRSGFAHLYEHLMFMGTNRIPEGQFDARMEAVGGSNNASTATDRTNYFSSGPSNILPLLLYLDADRLEDLGRAMTERKVDLQREVVLNERRQGVENSPYGKAYEAIPALMYPAGHPYSWSVIGSQEDLRAADAANVKEFFATFYVPNNATLVVAGDFNPTEIKPLVAKWFGTLAPGKTVPRRRVPAINFKGVKRVAMTDAVQAAKTIMVWHSPKSYSPGDFAMDAAGGILSDGVGTRLYDRLVTKDRLATEISAYQDSNLLGSTFTVDATLAEGASQDRLEAAIDDELRRFARVGPTAEELKRAVAKLEAGTLGRLESLASRADLLNAWNFYYGDPDSLDRFLKSLRDLTPTSVRRVSGETLDLGRRLVVRVTPEPEKKPAMLLQTQNSAQAQNPRAEIPKVSAPTDFAPPLPSSFKLSNGMEVFYLQRPALPLMSVVMAFRRGADTDPVDKGGRASLAAAMLREGAGELDAQAFARGLDLLGANFGAGVDRQSASVSLTVPSRGFSEALRLGALAVKSPRFDADAWERVKRLALAEIDQRGDDPNTVARLVAQRELFGAGTLYGRALDGEKTSVEGLDTAALKEAHAAIFAPEAGAIFVAGSLGEAEVKAALEREFGGWKPAAVSATVQPATPATNRGTRVVIVDRPGAVQTIVNVVAPGFGYGDANRVGLSAVGTVLGGSFTSRLNQNLREAKGYTYGASSRFDFGRELGSFRIGTQVRADVTGASLKEILSELTKIRGGDLSDADAAKASSLLRQNLIDGLESNAGLLGTYADLWTLGVPFSGLGTDLRGYSALTAAGANALAKSGIDFENAVIVLVGDRKAIEAQLAGLGLPAPTVVNGN